MITTSLIWMNTLKTLDKLAALCLMAGALCGVLESNGAQSSKRAKVDDSLFTNDLVLPLESQISDKGMALLRQYEWSREAKLEDRLQVRATIREGSILYTNVGLHL